MHGVKRENPFGWTYWVPYRLVGFFQSIRYWPAVTVALPRDLRFVSSSKTLAEPLVGAARSQ